tara:strand:- start:871 stop:1887 length:1017 start_codon:yes stop_codon:yes gene_type:complete
MSKRVMTLLASLSPEIEIYSIDEAFMNLAGIKKCFEIGLHMRDTVKKHTGIPISIGIASTKTLAKVANHCAKRFTKKGVYVLKRKDHISEILKSMPVSKLWGVGSRYSRMLRSYGVDNAHEFVSLDEKWVLEKMTVMGLRIQRELKGESCISMDINPSPKKNICTSRSFGVKVRDFQSLKESISSHAARCAEKLRLEKGCARYVSVVIKTNPFSDSDYYCGYKSSSFDVPTNDTLDIINAAENILRSIYKKGLEYKKSGVIVGDIIPQNQVQLNLFDMDEKRIKRKKLDSTVDIINQAMGRSTIHIGSQGIAKNWQLKREKLSPCYTTKWDDLLTINC